MNDMALTGSPCSLRARWVFPVSEPPLKDGVVTIADGRIVAVGSGSAEGPVEDLGEVALIPGLVNAHTHLEFSDLQQPIGSPEMDLVGWLRAVMEHRGRHSPKPAAAEGEVETPRVVAPFSFQPAKPAAVKSPIALGIEESLRHGVTTIGEIAQPRFADAAYHSGPCGGTLFLELIAPRMDRVEAALEVARTHLESAHLAPRDAAGEHLAERDEYVAWRVGLSPHAPYTVHPKLLVRAAALSAEFRAPLAMHLAESREELEFLRDHSGPFRELLDSRGGFDPAARHRGGRPLDELRCLLHSHRALVIHGNYLDDEEIEFLGWHCHRMAVVFCPRSHAWFDHAAYPLKKLLAAGAVVALGTDSRASSPDLSILAEMRHVAQSFPSISRATILELGTLGGARALGRDSEIGTLQQGKWADLTAIRMPDYSITDPHELLIDGEGDAVGTWVRGERCD
jgi:cytosine/adenosine deaminase-related metal-dependent hydrolase